MAGNYTVLREWVQWMFVPASEMEDKADISLQMSTKSANEFSGNSLECVLDTLDYANYSHQEYEE
jgi:hypothetical protein